ncbi:MAG TPA: histidine phosphatase family protein [Candidatus Dormibacteraeota bacterium]|nr:histidine phosphatase family protein [Candidatus Dormibacteraeota bacterium]
MRPSWAARACGRSHRKREPLAPLRQARDDGQARLSFELYLARHGETEWSLSGRHTGSTDIPLTARGEDNARQVGHRLRGIHFGAVYSSPMQRALRTAQLAGFEHPEITDLLQEFDYGEYEGLTTEQIRAKDPGWDLYRDGCPGGESPTEVYARAERFIALVAKLGEERALAFAHGHILRAVAVAWISASITVATNLQLDVATLNILRDGDHGRVIVLWNASS